MLAPRSDVCLNTKFNDDVVLSLSAEVACVTRHRLEEKRLPMCLGAADLAAMTWPDLAPLGQSAGGRGLPFLGC